MAETRLELRDLIALVESGRALTAQVDLSDLLNQILTTAGGLMDSPDGAVFLYDAEANGLYFAAATGASAATVLAKYGEASGERIPLESAAGVAFSEGRSTVATNPRHYRGVDEETGHVTVSMVCVPLALGDDRIGAMQVLNKRTGAYTEYDRILLESFASQAAVAIRNARLIRQLVAHAGLYTGRREGTRTADLLAELAAPAHVERMTVVFADMRGFSRLAQIPSLVQSPEAVQGLLTEFLSLLASEVVGHDGIVNKFLGDGLLALFRGAESEWRAVRAAFAMLDGFARLRARWDDELDEDIGFVDVGIGIVTDKVIIGPVGSTLVRDFTAIGTAVNLAAAFEHDARGGRRILVSQNTYRAVQSRVVANGPETYTLKKADQKSGTDYKRYHLVRLRGAGPDETERGPAAPLRLFVSHSNLDRQAVEKKLVEPLKEQGHRVFYSETDIGPAENYVRSIEENLKRADWMIVVVSRNSAGSQWVKDEVTAALAHPRLNANIVPVVLDDTPSTDINVFLGPRQQLDARKARVAERLSAVLLKRRGSR